MHSAPGLRCFLIADVLSEPRMLLTNEAKEDAKDPNAVC